MDGIAATSADGPGRLSERTASERAAAALEALAASQAEVARLQQALLEANLDVRRARAEARRLGLDADRAERREAATAARAQRMDAQWEALVARAAGAPVAPAPPPGLRSRLRRWLRLQA